MSKRNIAYVKPQDPSFLAQLKAQIGYKEGPSVETKRQKLQEDYSGEESGGEEGRPEREDEKPQIVVLQRGDLTADEVAKEEQRIAQEAAVARADLSQPIVFKKRHTKDTTTRDTTAKPSKKSKKQSKQAHNKLSFNDADEDDEEQEDQ